MRKAVLLLIAACLTLVSGTTVFAQKQNLKVQGTVTDVKGEVLVGVMVYVGNVDINGW